MSVQVKRAGHSVDMTQGSVVGHLVRFAIPLLLGNLFQQLYNTVDLWVVGRYVSNEAYSAVGTVTPIINMLIGFFLGLASGAGVVISQYYGAKKEEQVRQTVHTSLVMTVILGIVLTVVGILIIPLMLRLMKTDLQAVPEATTYLTIYCYEMSRSVVYCRRAANRYLRKVENRLFYGERSALAVIGIRRSPAAAGKDNLVICIAAEFGAYCVLANGRRGVRLGFKGKSIRVAVEETVFFVSGSIRPVSSAHGVRFAVFTRSVAYGYVYLTGRYGERHLLIRVGERRRRIGNFCLIHAGRYRLNGVAVHIVRFYLACVDIDEISYNVVVIRSRRLLRAAVIIERIIVPDNFVRYGVIVFYFEINRETLRGKSIIFIFGYSVRIVYTRNGCNVSVADGLFCGLYFKF